ncbi:MAG: hypothetical protein E7373_06570 [Clostridiales bacterium]|nr:hypothetical protein [Clostridiales bacterium]
MRNELGNFANSMVHWTMQAVECYRNGCICRNCDVKIKSQKCQMKAVVLELVKMFGEPKEEDCKSWSFKGYGRKRDISNPDGNKNT